MFVRLLFNQSGLNSLLMMNISEMQTDFFLILIDLSQLYMYDGGLNHNLGFSAK